jgi:hypothetical protein
VFTFKIYVWITWQADGLSEYRLDAVAERLAPQARRQILGPAANLARHFYPHQAAELEMNLNRQLSKPLEPYDYRGSELRAYPTFMVRLDEDVKAELRPAYLQRVRMESEHQIALRRAQMLDQLTRRWADVIMRLRQSPFAAAAAKLTDERLASILDELTVAERTTVDELATLLREAIRDSNRVGQPLEQHEADEIIELLNAALRNGPEEPGSTPNGKVNGQRAASF